MGYSILIFLKRQFRKPKTIVLFLIMAIGLILILWQGSHRILQGIGVSLLASGIMSIMSIFFINDEDAFRSAKDWGLEHVYSTRGEMNHSCDEYMRHAKSIKIIAFGLRSLRDAPEADILRILSRNGKIKIITMKPGCEALTLREKDERQEISGSIEELIAWAKDLNAKGMPGKIEIRYHDHLPLDFMFLMNNRLFTGPYEYGKVSQQTVSFEYSATGAAYEYYEKYFDRLWEDEHFCQDALSD